MRALKLMQDQCDQRIALVYWKNWSTRERADELQRLLKERRAIRRAIKENGRDPR